MKGQMMMMLNLLPVVITGPGFYKTRKGEKVEILNHMTNNIFFRCEGYYPDGIREFWHRSGRLYHKQECPNDIVAPWVD